MSKGKFLIVEDEFVVAENLRTVLVSMGYEVVGMASSGKKAIELARQEKPDMALMDIKLKGEMDGIETAIHFQKELDIPVLFLTAFADESLLERAKLVEPLGYIVKPYERKTLRASIEMAHYKARMERQLKESEERFRTIVENANEVITVTQDGMLKFINPKALEILGYSEKELLSRSFIEFVHPDDQQMVMLRHLKRQNGEEIPEVYVFRSIVKDSEIKFLETNEVIITWEGKPAILNMLTDITQRKRIQDALQESENRYRLLADNAMDVIWTVDFDNRMTYASPSIKKLVGFTVEEAMARTMQQAFTPTSFENAIQIFAEEIAIENSEHGDPSRARMVELEMVHKDGNTVPIEGHFSFLRDPSGKPIGVLAIVRDITERKRFEAENAELEAQNWQLQKAESLGCMAGAIAHHFNNQLQVVMGNMEMAMVSPPLGADTSALLEEALKAAHKAAHISGQMLTYRGQAPGKHALLDLSENCLQTLPILQAAAPKRVILKADFPSPGPVICANAGQIQQVLTNLVSNAFEAVGKNQGVIALTVKTVSRADIPFSKHFPIEWQPEDIVYACLEVADPGCGITENDIDKIFDPFFTTKFTGRGLGLPVVLGIVRTQHGAITVESKPGWGSIFRVLFPVSTKEAPHKPDKLSQPPETLGGATVLVVDDDEMVRNMATTMLRHLGFSVIEAKDGIEAVEIFRKHKDEIRCVLSDLTMPRMDGWETLAAMRELSPGIPVILSSGYDEAQVMAEEHTEQPDAFLGKPYQLKGLRETISRVLAANNNDRN